MEDLSIVNEIYNKIFCNIQHGNIDLFYVVRQAQKKRLLIEILSGVN